MDSVRTPLNTERHIGRLESRVESGIIFSHDYRASKSREMGWRMHLDVRQVYSLFDGDGQGSVQLAHGFSVERSTDMQYGMFEVYT